MSKQNHIYIVHIGYGMWVVRAKDKLEASKIACDGDNNGLNIGAKAYENNLDFLDGVQLDSYVTEILLDGNSEII